MIYMIAYSSWLTKYRREGWIWSKSNICIIIVAIFLIFIANWYLFYDWTLGIYCNQWKCISRKLTPQNPIFSSLIFQLCWWTCEYISLFQLFLCVGCRFRNHHNVNSNIVCVSVGGVYWVRLEKNAIKCSITGYAVQFPLMHNFHASFLFKVPSIMVYKINEKRECRCT